MSGQSQFIEQEVWTEECRSRRKMIESLLSFIADNSLKSACVFFLILVACDLLIRKIRKIHEFRRKVDSLPGPPTTNTILGNIPLEVLSLIGGSNSQKADSFYTSQIQSLLGHTIIYKDESLFRLWFGQEPVVCVWKPEIVERVLGDNHLLEKSYHYDFLRPWLGNGLLTSPGRIWRPRRKLLVPSFHFNILEPFVNVFERKSKLLVGNLKRKLAESSKESLDKGTTIVVDITPIITACTLDAICETIMGVSIDAQENPNNDYCQSIYVVGETFLERIIQPRYWLDLVFRSTELGKLYNYHLDKLHSFTRTVIQFKKGALNPNDTASKQRLSSLASRVKLLEKSTIERYLERREDRPKLPKAFLDLLLEKTADSNGKQKLTDEEIREEVDTFMFEGHDTTAMALSWSLFLLGHHPDVQQKLQREVDAFFELHQLSDIVELELDHMKQLKYLECVIKESLRLCPSVPFIGRQTQSEMEIGGHLVPAGCVVFVLIYQLHRNPEIFPQPERFDPSRFLPENVAGRHPFAYVPFSAGPRNCIGQKFALAEMKTILLHAIRNFQFESITPLDKARMQMEMVLRPKSSLDIRISARQHS